MLGTLASMSPDHRHVGGSSVGDRLITYGADLAGAIAGSAIGATAGGAPGAASGAVLGAILGSGLTSALGEAGSRIMSRREKSRVGAVAIFAREKLLEAIEDGARLRGDDLIRARIDGRSPADEVIEHVLQVAQRSYEERKLPHIGAVLAHVAVSEWLDEATAHWLLATIERLSWPKLVALSLVAGNEDQPLPDAKIGAVSDWSPWSVHHLFTELQHIDMLARREMRTAERGMPDASSYFNDIRLTSGGKLLYWAGDLESVSARARDDLRATITEGLAT